MQEFLVFFFLPDKPELAMNGIFLQIYVQGNSRLYLLLKQVSFFMRYTRTQLQRV